MTGQGEGRSGRTVRNVRGRPGGISAALRAGALRLRLALLLAAVLLLAARSGQAEEAEAPPVPGQSAPAFALPDLHGNRVTLEGCRGKATLVNFWAFWCDTWKHELKQLKELRRARPDLAFEVLFVSVDSMERSQAEELLLREGVFFPVLVDIRGEVRRRWGVTTVPSLFLLDGQGTLRYTHQGYPGNRLLAREIANCAGGVEEDGSLVQVRERRLLQEFLLPEEHALLSRINTERAQRGLVPLRLVPAMTEVGREYLQRQLVRDDLSHYGPEPPDVRLRARGVKFWKMGENLARATDARQAVQAMLASPAHKANLLNPHFDRVGVAALSAGARGHVYCILFGASANAPGGS